MLRLNQSSRLGRSEIEVPAPSYRNGGAQLGESRPNEGKSSDENGNNLKVKNHSSIANGSAIGQNRTFFKRNTTSNVNASTIASTNASTNATRKDTRFMNQSTQASVSSHTPLLPPTSDPSAGNAQPRVARNHFNLPRTPSLRQGVRAALHPAVRSSLVGRWESRKLTACEYALQVAAALPGNGGSPSSQGLYHGLCKKRSETHK